MIIRIGTVVLLAGMALLYVWQHAKVMQLGYEMVNLRMKRAELLQKNKLWQVELAALKSPERIERMARENLNMQPADRVEIVEPEQK